MKIDLDRKNEMISLRENSGATLQEIADIFSISRERVRQIIGNTGRDFRLNWTLDKIKSSSSILSTLTTNDFNSLDLPGIKSVWVNEFTANNHLVLAGKNGQGQRAEYYIHDELIKNDIKNTLMKYREKYDILCSNGCRINVKSTHTAIKTTPKIKSNQWAFGINKLNLSTCDVFICVLPTNEYFVIPVNRAWERLAFCWPTKRPQIHKYLDCYMNIDYVKYFKYNNE